MGMEGDAPFKEESFPGSRCCYAAVSEAPWSTSGAFSELFEFGRINSERAGGRGKRLRAVVHY